MFLHLHSTKNYTQTCRPAVHNCYDWGRPVLVGGGIAWDFLFLSFSFYVFFFSWGCMSLSREDSRKICTLVYTIRFHSAPNTRPLVFSRAHLLFFFSHFHWIAHAHARFYSSLFHSRHTHNTHAYIQTVFLSLFLSLLRAISCIVNSPNFSSF